jgi:cysteine-rich repeat protein
MVEGNEVCDDGMNTGMYGGCEPGCMARAPYCGDAIVENPPEACDDGNNVATYGGNMQLCGPGCQLAPYCGDGVVSNGEQCDDGSSNGVTGDKCNVNCRLIL